MLNEAPKKKEDLSHPTKWKLFWRIQKECWRHMVTPALMYMFTGLTAVALYTLINNFYAHLILEILLLLSGVGFNIHLCFQYGKMHYDAYVTGCLHRQNEIFGIQSGGNHRVEKEYRPWKGFYIGFLVGVPVLIFGGLGHIEGARSVCAILLMLFSWWSFIPASLVSSYHFNVLGAESFPLSTIWSLPMIVLPVLVSGISYIMGAYINKRNRETGKVPKAPAEKKKR